MTTTLSRKTDAPLSLSALFVARQAGIKSAEIETRLLANMYTGEEFDHRLNQTWQRILWRAETYKPLQKKEFDSGYQTRKEELKEGLQWIQDNAMPYWETHDTMTIEHAPNLHEIVVLGRVPSEMMTGPYSSGEEVMVPRQVTYHI